MKKSLIARFSAVLVALLVLSACGGDSGSVEVQDATYRVVRDDLGAGYLTISNTTDADVTLTAASAEGVGSIELHESMLGDDGTMAMVSRPEGFVVAAGETVALEPGGKHLMLFDPSSDGEDLALTLTVDGEPVEVVATFDATASASSMDDMDHGDDGMEGMDHSDDAMDDREESE